MPAKNKQITSVTTLDGSPVDIRQQVWSSRQAALDGIDALTLSHGVNGPRKVGISIPVEENGIQVEYWFQGGIADVNFVLKSDNYLHTRGNETKTGILTFVNSPIVPTATQGTQAVNLGQLTTASLPKPNGLSSPLGQVDFNETTNIATVTIPFKVNVGNETVTTPLTPNNNITLPEKDIINSRFDLIVYNTITSTYDYQLGIASISPEVPFTLSTNIKLAEIFRNVSGASLAIPTELTEYYKTSGGKVNGPIIITKGENLHLKSGNPAYPNNSGDIIAVNDAGIETHRIIPQPTGRWQVRYNNDNNQRDDIAGLKDLISKITNVANIVELQAFNGLSNTLVVQDNLRGGIFNYISSGVHDNGLTFTATGKGSGFWKRDISNSQVYDVRWFGAINDGIINNTTILQTMLNTIPENTEINFPNGIYNFTELTLINKSRITFSGNATLKGKLIIGSINTPQSSRFEYHFKIKGLKFDFSHISYETITGYHAIILANALSIDINDVTFKGTDAAIYVYPINGFQHVARVSVNNCKVEMRTIGTHDKRGINYFIYVDNVVKTAPYTGISMGIGDIHIQNNNNIRVNIGHIIGFGVDGALISGNTFFHSGGFYKSQIKEQNIRIVAANWINISNNNLFESGYESILLEKFTNCTIGTNNIAWPGQRDVVRGYGIKLTGGGFPDVIYSNSSITGNIIALPTREGIRIDDGSNHISITSNQITSPGNGSQYYGDGTKEMGDPLATPLITSVSSLAGGFGSTCENLIWVSNVCNEKYFNFPVNEAISIYKRPRNIGNIGFAGLNEMGTTSISLITSNSISATSRFLYLNVTTGGTINTINGGNIGQTLTIYNGSNAVTLVNSSTLVLRGGVNVSIPYLATVTLVKNVDHWLEIARSTDVDIATKTGIETLNNKTISGGSNTIVNIQDASLSSNVVLINNTQNITGTKTFSSSVLMTSSIASTAFGSAGQLRLRSMANGQYGNDNSLIFSSGTSDVAGIRGLYDNYDTASSGGRLEFYTRISNSNVSEAGRITNKGNWLIGTTIDGIYKLNVNGSTRLSSTVTLGVAPTTSAGTYDILTRNGTTGLVEKVSSTTFGSGTVNSVTSANTDIVVATGTTTPVLTFNSAGYIKNQNSGAVQPANITINGQIRSQSTVGSYPFTQADNGGVAVVNSASVNALIMGDRIRYENNGFYQSFYSAPTITAQHNIYLPDASGTVALNGALFDNYTTVGNVGATETDLATYTIPANRLANNGEKIVAEYYGKKAATDGNLKIYFAGVVLFTTSTDVADWYIKVKIIRVSPTVIRYSIIPPYNLQFAVVGELTGLILSNTNVLKVTGTHATANNITYTMGTGEWKPAAQ